MEVAEYRNGKAHENEINDDGEYIVVNSKFVSTNGEIRKFSYAQNEPLYENEIAFVLSDVPNGRAIARTFLVDKSGKYTLNQRIAGITPHEDTDPYYLYIKMNRNEYFLKFDDGNKQTNLSIKDVLNYEDMYPSYKEQQKIGMYFQQLDHLITLHQRKSFLYFSRINDWEQRKLGDWGDFYYGRSCPKWSVTEDATIPCIRYGELYTKFGAKIDRVYSYTNMPPENLRFSKGTEVLIPRVGENPMDYNHCTWLSMKDVAIGEMISVFNTDNNPLFTATMFNATLQNEFAMRVEGGSVTNLYFEKLKNIDVSFPSIREQEMIAAYFENIDNLITLHQRKCDETKKLKKFMLQKMFPKKDAKKPEIRFAGFTNDWEQRKFANITMRESTVGVSSSTYPSVEYEDVIAGEGRLNKDIKYKEQQKTGIVFNGTQILYGKLRPYLHNWLNPDFSGIAVGDWWVLKPVETDKSFIYRLIQTQQFDDVANQSAGSKMPRADWNLVSNTEFRIPKTSEEQMAIGTYFSNLDHLITLHRRAYYNKKGGLTNVHNDNQQYYAIL